MRSPRGIGSLRHLVVLSVAACAAVSACTSQMAGSPYVKARVDEQDFDGALDVIEGIDQKTSRLLYFYQKGLVLHYSARYRESNDVFEQAERLYDDLYTKSLSREVGALLTSDNVVQFRGERFESALIHYYKILNYLFESDTEGALVECRKLNNKLRSYADSGDSVYVNDPFLQYLTGMVYFDAGQLDDAGVSLRAAASGYVAVGERYRLETPASLPCDLISCAERLGDLEAAASYRSGAGACDTLAPTGGSGTLNVFLECGYVPHKIEQNIVFPIYKNEVHEETNTDDFAHTLSLRYGQPVNEGLELDYLLRVALPAMVPSPEPLTGAAVRVNVGGTAREARAQVVQNLDALAFEAFGARQGGIVLKAVTRALVKYLAKEGVDDESEVAGWFVNMINVATESADTRSWDTLPQTIRMARLVLPEGTYNVEIILQGADGADETSVFEGVEIKPGRAVFVNFRAN